MFLKSNWHAFRVPARNCLGFLWSSYSTPTPHSAKHVLTLLFLCLIISISTGGLLFHWLRGLLRYHLQTAGIATGVYTVAILILLFLVHPLRCAFTLMFPTLGTQQGRKLVLSLCVMIVLIHVLPNIATNIVELTQLMKCTSENVAHSVLNSSELSNIIKRDLVSEVKSIKESIGAIDFVEKLTSFNQSTDIDVSGLRENLKTLSKHVGQDLTKAIHQLDELKLLLSRILAAGLVIYLFMDSSIYLKSYLTSVRFDNVYITGLLKRNAESRGLQVEAKDVKNGVNVTSFRMSKSELLKCVLPILMITLYLLMTIMLLVLDYIVHYAVETGGPWLLDIPPTDIAMEIIFNVSYHYNFCEIFLCKPFGWVIPKRYNATISSDVTRCKTRPSKLNAGVILALFLLYILSYCLTFLEVYARRLRRTVASSFFQLQEKKRITFLIDQVMTKKKKKQTKLEEIESTENRRQGNDKKRLQFLTLDRLYKCFSTSKDNAANHTDEKQEPALQQYHFTAPGPLVRS